jgi:hypothetical protein
VISYSVGCRLGVSRARPLPVEVALLWTTDSANASSGSVLLGNRGLAHTRAQEHFAPDWNSHFRLTDSQPACPDCNIAAEFRTQLAHHWVLRSAKRVTSEWLVRSA